MLNISRVTETALLRAVWILSLCAGAVQAYVTRHTMNADGVSYLDIGEAYWSGGWRDAVVGYWSPMYSWIMGGALRLIAPEPRNEYAVVHLVNFALYAAALGAFHFFLGAVMRRDAFRAEDREPFPRFCWILCGYSLFLWSTLGMMTLATVSPDITMAMVWFLVAGILLRIAHGGGLVWCAVLGLTLALGYLVRGYMFALAFLILAAAAMVARPGARIASAVTGLLVFVLAAAPYVWLLSSKRGKFTFSEAGSFIYAWHINRQPWQHWQHPDAVHPSRKIFDEPAVFEFAAPIRGSYSPWFDPGYWLEGMKPKIDLKAQARMVVRHFWEYFDMVWVTAFIPILLVLQLFGGGARAFLLSAARQWFLLLPAVAGLCLFGALHVEPRYVAIFFLLIFVALLLSVDLPKSTASGRLLRCAGIAFATALLAQTARVSFVLAHEGLTNRDIYWRIADAIHREDIQPGSSVATINQTNRSMWPRLARVRVIAEVPTEQTAAYWASPPDVRNKVLQALAAAGASAVITDHVPGPAATGWRALGSTGYFLYPLRTTGN